jgi:hypothetical protein
LVQTIVSHVYNCDLRGRSGSVEVGGGMGEEELGEVGRRESRQCGYCVGCHPAHGYAAENNQSGKFEK